MADVIAVIQAMATYKFYKLDFSKWAGRICGSKSAEDVAYWKRVIEEYPEFFRLNGERDEASLVWRRNYQRTYHVDLHREITKQERDALPEEERMERVSRLPLSSSDISVLINTAIELHSRALELEKASKWWVTPTVGLFGILLGALLNGYSS